MEFNREWLMENRGTLYPIAVFIRMLLASIAVVGALALWDQKKPVFSFSWKRVLAVFLFIFAIYEVIPILFLRF